MSELVGREREAAPETTSRPAGEAKGEAPDAAVDREILRLEEALLASRDTVISHEVRLGEALAHARRLEAELVRYQERMDQLDAILGSRSWRIGGALHRLAMRFRRSR